MATNWSSWSPSEIIKYFTKTSPVNVVGLAEALGIKVWEKNFEGNISGVVKPDPNNGGPSGYSIYVNAGDSYTRKRFTVAHEIAHFLLHRNKDTKEFSDDLKYRSPGVSDQLEAQANRLAADILMPRRLIRELLDKGVTEPTDMAARLQVSPKAMEIRLGLPPSRPFGVAVTKSPHGANQLSPSISKELSESVVGNK